MVGDVAERFALQGRDERRGHCSVEHHLGRAKALVHIATARELHRQPVGLNLVRFDKFDENTDVHVADLDHLGENETLFDVSEIGFHDNARIQLSDASEEKKSKKGGDVP